MKKPTKAKVIKALEQSIKHWNRMIKWVVARLRRELKALKA